MNTTFINLFNNRLSELTQDLEFDHKSSGTKRPPVIYNPMLPPKASGYKEGDEFAYIRWAIFAGGFDVRRPAPFSVIVHGGIYTAGSIDNGNSDILLLAMALGRMVKNRSFPPYRMETPVPFVLGDPSEDHEGLQPHPYYFVRMKVNFLMPDGHGG